MCVKNDGNETRSTATIRVDIPPSKITKLHELEKESVSNGKYTTRRDCCLTKKPENIEFIKIVKAELKISSTENHYQVMIEILKRITVFAPYKNCNFVPEKIGEVIIPKSIILDLLRFIDVIPSFLDDELIPCKKALENKELRKIFEDYGINKDLYKIIEDNPLPEKPQNKLVSSLPELGGIFV